MIFLVPMILAQQPAIEETGEEDSQPANFRPSYFAPSWLVTPQELMHRIPRSAVSEMNKAEKANREHKADEEIAHLKKAVALDPDLVWARSHLASCLIPSDTQTAIAHLEEAIKVDPRQPVLFHNLAVAYLYDNQVDAAEAAARRARALGLKDLRSRVLLGWILLERRQYTIETLTLVQSGGEQYSVAYLIAARVLIEQGNLSDAVRNLRSYLSSGDTTFLPVAEEWLNFSLSTARKLMENPD